MNATGPGRILFGDRAGLTRLCEGFNRGFSDYKYGARFDEEGMARFLERSGMALADCAVLVCSEGGIPRGAGVALLARHGSEAWCGGLAVAPEQRRRGWAARLMQAVQQRARAGGAHSLRLEVLAWNQPARALYHSLGYREERELLIWERSPRQGPLPLPYERLQETAPEPILDEMHAWHDLVPAWQRRVHFLRRLLPELQGLTIPARDGQPVAYALCRHAGSAPEERLQIVDVAVDPAAPLLDAGRPLLQALQLRYRDAVLLLVNEPADSKLNRIFVALGFTVSDRQYELSCEL